MTASERIYHIINDNPDITGLIVCKKMCAMMLDEEIFKNDFIKFEKHDGISVFCKVKNIPIYLDIYLDEFNIKILPDFTQQTISF